MKKGLTALVAAVTVAIGGCGGSSAPKQTTPQQPNKPAQHVITDSKNQKHVCSKSDYALQCAVAGQQASGNAITQAGAGSVHGVDFAWGAPSCGTFQANGWKVAATYYDTHDMSKGWSRGLANYFSSCGVSHVAVWESSAGEATNGYGAGQQDARDAVYVANLVGEPSNRPIFFAVDCDCSGGSVASYFDGVKSVIGYNRTGAYAGYYPINYLFNTGRIKYGWQTYAWSGGNWDSRANFRQYLNDNSVDYDLAIGNDYGQWPFASAPTGPSHADIVKNVKGKKAAKNAFVKNRCGDHPLYGNCAHYRRLVTAYQGWLEKVAGYKHVFIWGPAVQYSQAVSVVVRPTGAAWGRYAERSHNYYWGTSNCRNHPKRRDCVEAARETAYGNGHLNRAQRLNRSKYWATI